MRLTGQRRRPARIKNGKLRILSNFPGMQYVEKAPGADDRSYVVAEKAPGADARSYVVAEKAPGAGPHSNVVPDDRRQAKISRSALSFHGIRKRTI